MTKIKTIKTNEPDIPDYVPDNTDLLQGRMGFSGKVEDYRFQNDDLEPGCIYLKDLEEIYGRKFTQDEVKKLRDKEVDWLPYDVYLLDDICNNWLYDEEQVRKTMNRILFTKQWMEDDERDETSVKTYRPNGEVMS